MNEQQTDSFFNKCVLESPELELNFDQLNDQSKKIDFSYDKQVY
jgi:hypothetical protein